jgi:hypothetical protein
MIGDPETLPTTNTPESINEPEGSQVIPPPEGSPPTRKAPEDDDKRKNKK